MKLNDQDKKFMVNEFLRNISHITDEEYQRRVWVRGEGPEGQDFDEAVCSFFDMGESILEDYKDFNITDNQYRLLIEFQDAYREFSLNKGMNYLPEEFISSLEWKKIIEMAVKVLEAFNYRKTSASCKPIKNIEQINKRDWIVLDEILNDPSKVVYPFWKGSLKIYTSNGRGAFFKEDGSFRGFIEQSKKSYFSLWKRFTIEVCSDLDFRGKVIDVCYDRETVASVKYDGNKMNIETLPFGRDPRKGHLPGIGFGVFLRKAKCLAVKLV
ncbi:MAG: hypothetical protein V4489_07920 [Chlamydiota bacterium]